MSIKLANYFAVSGVEASGKRVFYATDSRSDDCPYWSSSVLVSQMFSYLRDVPVIGKNDYMRKDVIRIEILEVQVIANVVSKEDIVSEAKVEAMREIAEIQKRLQEKTKALEKMV